MKLVVKPEKPPKTAMNFYADESCQNGHRYLAIGTIAIFKRDVPRILADLAAVREEFKHGREMGWTCVSSYKYAAYDAWVDIFIAYAKKRRLRFTVLTLDSSLTNRKVHGSDHDLGFSKLLYQLLLHRVGRRYGKDRLLYGYLDSRTTRHTPEKLRRMLNAGLSKQYKIRENPFRNLEFKDSRESDLIQLTDILTGAVSFALNQKATRPEKLRLAEKITRIRRLSNLARWQFDIWPFQPKTEKVGTQGPRRF